MCGITENAVPGFDERHHLVNEELGVALPLRVGLGRAEILVDVGKVLGEPFLPAGVVDPHHDHRRDSAGRHQRTDGLVDTPLHRIEHGRRRIEQVLSVVEIQHRVSALCVLRRIVAIRDEDAQHPRVAEDATPELVQPQVSHDLVLACPRPRRFRPVRPPCRGQAETGGRRRCKKYAIIATPPRCFHES